MKTKTKALRANGSQTNTRAQSAKVPTPATRAGETYVLSVVRNGKSTGESYTIDGANAERLRAAAREDQCSPLEFIGLSIAQAESETLTPVDDATPIRAQFVNRKTGELLCRLDLSESEWHQMQIHCAARNLEDQKNTPVFGEWFVRLLLLGKVPNAAAYFTEGEIENLQHAVTEKQPLEKGWTITTYIRDAVIRQMRRDFSHSPLLNLEMVGNESIAMLELLSFRSVKLEEKEPGHLMSHYASGVVDIVSNVQQNLREVIQESIDYARGRAPESESAAAAAAA